MFGAISISLMREEINFSKISNISFCNFSFILLSKAILESKIMIKYR